jgi:HEPN domain-containing protein
VKPSRVDLNEEEMEEESIMRDKVNELLKATQALVAYIEEHYVFDKLADAGCGLYDTYRSDDFEKVVNSAKRVANELAEELSRTG